MLTRRPNSLTIRLNFQLLGTHQSCKLIGMASSLCPAIQGPDFWHDSLLGLLTLLLALMRALSGVVSLADARIHNYYLMITYVCIKRHAYPLAWLFFALKRPKFVNHFFFVLLMGSVFSQLPGGNKTPMMSRTNHDDPATTKSLK